jgi:hypothetical protein
MPTVYLSQKEADGELPTICMCCGKPANIWVNRSFLKHEPPVKGPSVFLEIFALRLLLAMATTPTFHLRTSFCESHRYYWLWRSVLVFGGIGAMIAVIFGGLVFVALLIFIAKVDAPWLSCCVIGPFLLFLIAWVIPLKLTMGNTIRARLMEDGRIALTNVDESYVAAVEALQKHPI